MSQNVEPLRAASVQRVQSASDAPGPDLSERRRAQEDADRIARHRLIIEGDPAKGYVYKSVDRLTGQVVSEYPRETVLRLQSDPDYSQGSVIDTKA